MTKAVELANEIGKTPRCAQIRKTRPNPAEMSSIWVCSSPTAQAVLFEDEEKNRRMQAFRTVKSGSEMVSKESPEKEMKEVKTIAVIGAGTRGTELHKLGYGRV